MKFWLFIFEEIKLRKIIVTIVCILIISLSVIFSGCSSANTGQIEKISDLETLLDEENTSSTTDTNSAREFKEISVDEAYKIFTSDKDYLFIDVRYKKEYFCSHTTSVATCPITINNYNFVLRYFI